MYQIIFLKFYINLIFFYIFLIFIFFRNGTLEYFAEIPNRSKHRFDLQTETGFEMNFSTMVQPCFYRKDKENLAAFPLQNLFIHLVRLVFHEEKCKNELSFPSGKAFLQNRKEFGSFLRFSQWKFVASEE